LLDDGAQMILPTKRVTPRDEAAKTGAHLWNLMEAPTTSEPERVYFHDLASDSMGNTFAALVNNELKLGIKLSFNKKDLPNFVQWKTSASGDYAMGLEPSNSGLEGRTVDKDKLHMIEPFACEVKELTITVIEGEVEIEELIAEAKALVD
jgi:hypothetical protein